MFLFNKKKYKIGLALGGGGARGFAHLGVCKAFEEYGIKFDFICGTSVGSVIGAFLADGKSFAEMYNIAKSLKTKDIRNNKMFFLPSSTDGLQDLISNNLSVDKVEKLKTPFACVAVDLYSAKECVITKGEICSAVASSCSVPGVFEPVAREGKLFADGGLQDTIPAEIAKIFDCDFVVAVDVNPQRLFGAKSDKLIDILSCTIRILMDKNASNGYAFSDVMIKPDTKRFKSTKAENIDQMIEEGYNATIDQIKNIMEIFDGKVKPKKFTQISNVDII